MGCGNSKVKVGISDPWDEEGTKLVETLEANTLKELGWKQDEYVAKYTNIEMDGAPYRVRTFYFKCEDTSKKTLILTHGFMANIIGFCNLLRPLAEEYRLIAFDNCNWGLNTRSPAGIAACDSADLAE